jgi:hypothetical protein
LFKASAVVCILFLQGCGFKPLYLPDEGDGGAKELSHIKISTIAGRTGQQLRNELINLFTPSGLQKPVLYHMNIALVEDESKQGFRRDQTPTKADVTLNAKITLIDAETNRVVINEPMATSGTYSIGSSADFGAYAANVAASSTRRQLVKLLAQDIRVRVLGYLESFQEIGPPHENGCSKTY